MIPINKTAHFLDVRVDNVELPVALRQIRAFIHNGKNGRPAAKVFFTNVHSIILSSKDVELRENINNANLVLPDGSGLKIAGKLLNKPIMENLNGTDLTPKICKLAETYDWSVYLLGAKQEVLDGALKSLRKWFPNLNIVGSHHGYFTKDKEDVIIKEINNKKPDILLVALGSPTQEKWLTRYADQLQIRVGFAVGGFFDFISQEKNRAPSWMRKMGIEWLFRFFQDPVGKWNRIFIEIPVFLSMILKKKFELFLKRKQQKQDSSRDSKEERAASWVDEALSDKEFLTEFLNQETYSPEMKFRAVMDVVSNGHEIEEIAESYRVPSQDVQEWVRTFQENGPSIFNRNNEINHLESKIEHLEQLYGNIQERISNLQNNGRQ